MTRYTGTVDLVLQVNGEARRVTLATGDTLLRVLRERLCDEGQIAVDQPRPRRLLRDR